MQIKLGWIIILAVLSIVLCSCANNNPQISPNANQNNNNNNNIISEQNSSSQIQFKYIISPKKVFHNTYNMYMPENWSEVSINGGIVYLPPESELLDIYSEKITIAVTFLEKDDKRDLDTLIKDNEEKIKTTIKGYNVYSREKYKLGPLDGILIKGNLSVMNQTIEVITIDAVQDNRFYRFEITCRQSLCKYLDVYYEMASSFEPKNFG